MNDLWDRDIDRQVARTKDRPLASGELSAKEGLAWLGLHVSPRGPPAPWHRPAPAPPARAGWPLGRRSSSLGTGSSL